jgi:hypothetical protein
MEIRAAQPTSGPESLKQSMSEASRQDRAFHELGTPTSRLHRWGHHSGGEANAVESTRSLANVPSLRGSGADSMLHVR